MIGVIRLLFVIAACLGISSASANFAIFQTSIAPPVVCGFSKDIVADYSANNTGQVDVTAAFNTFNTAAVAYAGANPNANVCLNIPAGSFYFGAHDTGHGAGSSWTQSLPHLYVTGVGTLYDNLVLTTTASSASGTSVVHFGTVPATFVVGQQLCLVSECLGTYTTITGAISAINSPSTGDVTLTTTIGGAGVPNGAQVAVLGNGYFLGAGRLGGMSNDNAHYVNIATVSAGSSSATVSCGTAQCTTNLGNCSTLFHNGDTVVVAGLDMQGLGFPQNPYFWEYVVINSVNCGTGVFTFVNPLKYAYKSTWPNYNTGTSGEIYAGGPGTIYALRQAWNVTQSYDGVSYNSLASQLSGSGYSITFKNGSMSGFGFSPSVIHDISFLNFDTSSTGKIELDKLVENLLVQGGSSHGWFFQSATANDTITFSGHHVIAQFQNTPGKLIITNGSAIDPGIYPGAGAYGSSRETDCSNSAISVGVGITTGSLGGFTDTIIAASGSITNGVITVPRAPYKATGATDGNVPWAIPGTYVAWDCRFDYCGGGTTTTFQILDVTNDATNTYITTSLTGVNSFPAFNFLGTPSFKGVTTLPGRVTFTNCTGSADAVDLSQPGAQNLPLWSYSKRTYVAGTATPVVPIWGAMQNVNISVTAAGNAVNFNLNGPFVLDNTGTTASWSPSVVVNNPGGTPHTVAVTPTTVTGTQAGDSVSAPGSGTWLVDDQITPKFSGAAGTGSVTIEMITNQGYTTN